MLSKFTSYNYSRREDGGDVGGDGYCSDKGETVAAERSTAGKLAPLSNAQKVIERIFDTGKL